MENMLNPDSNYPFHEIKIKTPKALQGGTYCANLTVNGSPLLIQTPKCKTKNGIHKTAKQIYCDLVLTNDHEEFLEWFDKLQSTVQQLILENSSNWFHESPTLDEIEYNWNDSIRTRRDYCLLRTFVHKAKGLNKSSLQIFDTDENQLGFDDVDPTKNVISILEIIGLKFSSNSFHLEIGLRQLMVINEKPIFDKCLIKLNTNKQTGEKSKIEESSKKAEADSMEIDTVEEKPTVKDEEILAINEEETPIVNEEETPIVNEEEKLKEEEVDQSLLGNLVDETTIEDNNSKEGENTVDNTENEDAIQQYTSSIEEDNKTKNEDLENKANVEDQPKSLEKNNDLEEIELDIPEEEPMKLKNPTEVYLDIYRQAREKAKKAKNEAIKAYLEAKRIKELYMLDVVDSSSSDEESEEEEELFSEN